MKKIVAAFDGLKCSESTRDYAIYLAQQMNTHLVGLFMEDPIYKSCKTYDLIVKKGASDAKIKKLKAINNERRNTAARHFEAACRDSKLEYSIHHDHDIAIRDLKHESIYADLLIIGAKETLTHYAEKLPTRFIRDLLSDVQCPILVVQKKYRPVQKVIFLYDSEPSSVHAMKMFSHLLPQLKNLEIEVISLTAEDATLPMSDNSPMKEFIKRHYPKAKYTTLKGLAKEKIVTRLKRERDNALVVLGAYRRGAVGRLFRESMADILMKKAKQPLFIAQNKYTFTI